MSDTELPYYMPPSQFKRTTTTRDNLENDNTGRTATTTTGATAVSHLAVRRESTWRPGAAAASVTVPRGPPSALASASTSTSTAASRPTNAWATSRGSDRGASPGPSQSARARAASPQRSRNDSYYEPPDTMSSFADRRLADQDPDSRDRDRDRERDRDDRGRDRDDRGRDRDDRARDRDDRGRGGVGGGSGWRRREDDRGTWDDYRRRMDWRRDSNLDQDRDRDTGRGGGRGNWSRKDRDDDDSDRRSRGRADDRDRGQGWRKRNDPPRSPDDARDHRRSWSRSRSRSRDRSPWTKRRGRRSSFSDSDSDSDRDRRRPSQRWLSTTPDAKRRDPPSPDMPSAKRARDRSPPPLGRSRSREMGRSRSSTRSPTPPRRRRSTSPRSVNGRGDRARSPGTSPRKTEDRNWPDRARERSPDRDRSDRFRPLDRDRFGDRERGWQATPPRGPRVYEDRFLGRQAISQSSTGHLKMRQWGAPPKSPSPPTSDRRSPPPRTERPSVAPTAPGVPTAVPTSAVAAPAIPPGFRRAPPTGPRQRGAPPTGPANGNGVVGGNVSPRRPAAGWRPIQQPDVPVAPGFKRSVTALPTGTASAAVDAPEVDMEIDDDTPARNRQARRVPSPPKHSRWSPTKSRQSTGPDTIPIFAADNSPLPPQVYLDRLAEKEKQYDHHLRAVAPYVSTAFTQWYGQNRTPQLRDFLIHYLGRRPSNFEMDQINQLLKRRTQLSSDQMELRILHDQAVKYEEQERERAEAEATASVDSPRPRRAGPGEAYERLAQVGEGTYGKVYKARSVNTHVLVALKRIRMEQEKDGFPITSMREIKLLQALHHPNVVRLLEMMVSKGSVYMVLEYMNHDLTGILSHPEVVLSAANVKSLNYQMLSGLGYLHRRGILHRDMKGSNILLNGDGELKLADFGLARFYNKHKRGDYTNRVITVWYRSPELLMGETCYGPEVDMWSAGCIALEIFTTKPVFQGSDEIHQLEVIYQVLGTPDEAAWPGLTDLPWYELVRPRDVVAPRFRTAFAKWLSPAALDLVEGLLAFNPATRLLADDALKMPYFTEEEPQMERPTQLAECGEHHEMSVKMERHRRRDAK